VHEELERRPGPALGLEHPIDLPLAHQVRVRAPRLRPVRELREPAERPRQRGTLLDRALESLLSDRHVEPGLAQRVLQ
jgi:hypothetical protein